MPTSSSSSSAPTARPRPPGEPDLVGEALAVCEEIIRDCRAAGVPVVIENLVYERPGEDLRGQTREDAIIEAARALNDLDIDLLKLEYPGSPAGCRRLAAVLDRPWARAVGRRPLRSVHRHHRDLGAGGRRLRFHRRPLGLARSRQPHRPAAPGVSHLGRAAAAGKAHRRRVALGPALDRGKPRRICLTSGRKRTSSGRRMTRAPPAVRTADGPKAVAEAPCASACRTFAAVARC